VPVVVGHPCEQAVTREAGVVDEDVELADLVDQPARVLRIRDVGGDRSPARLLRGGVPLLRARAVADDDGRAGTCQLERDCATDPARASCDERGLAF
jgi:hypothetical protein